MMGVILFFYNNKIKWQQICQELIELCSDSTSAVTAAEHNMYLHATHLGL